MLAAVLTYGNTVKNSFSWDDTWLIVTNDRLTDPSYVHYMLFERTLWRPLKRISFMLDRAVWGLDHPGGFHATNVALHALASLLLFAAARRLGLSRAGAFAAGLLFAVHAGHVEAVANISHRKESMALVFSLLGLLAWLAARAESPPRAPGVTLLKLAWRSMPAAWSASAARLELVAWAALAYLCGLLSKEVGAVMLPAVIVVHELLRAQGGFRSAARRLAPFLALVAVILGLFVMRGYLGSLGTRFGPEQVEWVTLGRASNYSTMLLVAVKAVGFYAGFLAWPIPSYADRAFAIPQGLLDPGVLAGVGVLAAWGLGVVFTWRRSTAACLGLWWFLLNLLPVINVVPLTFWLVAERFVHGPSAGIALVAGAAFQVAWQGLALRPSPLSVRRAAGVLLAAAVTLHAARAAWQNRVWQSDRTLWENTLRHNPESWLAWSGVAPFHEADGRLDEAERCYREALRLNPRYADPHFGLGRLLLIRGDYEGAVREARIKADADAGDAASLMVIGNARFHQGRLAEAVEAYAEATARKPRFEGLAFNHANALRVVDRPGEALERLGPARAGDPKGVRVLRAVLLETLNRREAAVAAYRRVLELDPADAIVLRALQRLESPEP